MPQDLGWQIAILLRISKETVRVTRDVGTNRCQLTKGASINRYSGISNGIGRSSSPRAQPMKLTA